MRGLSLSADDDGDLPAEFREAKRRFNDLLQAFSLGRYSAQELAQQLAAVRVTTEDGAVWTLGAHTHLWYRRPAGGTEWEARSHPPLS